MTLEEFIMEYGSLIAMIVAGLGLLAVIGTVIKEFRDTARLEKGQDRLSDEHTDLSREHKDLSLEQKEIFKEQKDYISEKHLDLKEQQNDIKNTVVFLKDNALREQGRKEALSKQELDIKQTSDHIVALVDLLHNTQAENSNLKQENAELREKIKHYEQFSNNNIKLDFSEMEEDM